MCEITDKIMQSANTIDRILTNSVRELTIATMTVKSGRDVVYVVDMDTNEIVFVNDYTKELFGDVVGKVCYEAFHDSTYPCEFCTNEELIKSEDGFVIWTYFNRKVKRLYYIVDMLKIIGDKRYRFERATDITDSLTDIVHLTFKNDLI